MAYWHSVVRCTFAVSDTTTCDVPPLSVMFALTNAMSVDRNVSVIYPHKRAFRELREGLQI